MDMSRRLLTVIAQTGYFKGKLRDSYMEVSPVPASLLSMPFEEAMEILSSFELDKTPLLNFLARFTEDQIAKSGWASFKYATMVIHKPFPKGEYAIKNNLGSLGGVNYWPEYVAAFPQIVPE